MTGGDDDDTPTVMLSALVAFVVDAAPGFVRVPTPAGASTFAAAVSADGSTVVGQLGLADGGVEAFRWRIGDPALTELEVIGDLEGGLHFSSATGVSGDGAIVVGTGYRADASRPDDGVQVGFTFTSGGGFVELPDLPGGSILANAAGISDDGHVVVGSSYDDREDFVAVRWVDGVAFVVGAFAAEHPRSDGRGVSGDGSVIVGGSPSGGGALPRSGSFRCDDDGVLEDIGTFVGGGLTDVQAVSQDGHVVVGSAVSPNSGENFLEAFRKVDDGDLEALGDLDGGPFGSDALDVSAHGDVVVGRSVVNDSEDEEAFVWRAETGMRRLHDLVDAAGFVVDDGVTLSQATSVSQDGNVVVGNALVVDGDDRHVEAFVVVFADDEAETPELRVQPPASCGGCSGGHDNVVVAVALIALSGTRLRGSRRRRG